MAQELKLTGGENELESIELAELTKLYGLQEAKRIIAQANEEDDSFIDDELQDFIDGIPALDEEV